MQEIMPSRANWEALHRSHPRLEDRLHLGATLYWMWYLRKEVPFRCHQHHQSTNKPGVASYAPLLCKQFQAASASYAKTWTSPGASWNERNRQEYCLEDTQWQIEAKPGTI